MSNYKKLAHFYCYQKTATVVCCYLKVVSFAQSYLQIMAGFLLFKMKYFALSSVGAEMVASDFNEKRVYLH